MTRVVLLFWSQIQIPLIHEIFVQNLFWMLQLDFSWKSGFYFFFGSIILHIENFVIVLGFGLNLAGN